MEQSLDIIFDLCFGSSGKGLIGGYLATKNKYHFAIESYGVQAGHTVIKEDGTRYIVQQLPQALINNDTRLYIGAGAVIDLEQLQNEVDQYLGGKESAKNRLFIHPRASVIQQRHRDWEKEIIRSGSTFKGVGAASAFKVMRHPDHKLMRDIPEWSDFMADTAEMACDDLRQGKAGILEVAQGFELGINHGLQYPNCTSRECSPMQGLSDNGIPIKFVRNIYGVIRTYPIRISNEMAKEDGGQAYSGDGGIELTWEEVEKRSGAHPGTFSSKEYSTVTKKLRRVFELDINRIKRAVKLTGVTKLAVNFIQYINYQDAGITEYDKLSDKSKTFIEMVEKATCVPVILIGTGARNDQVIDRTI
ncbi:unnamed protein product [Adineta ricciae]|uniref:AdSS n=1 Tax=Adineta ricciae TaxID=249248 RepID=A0A814GQP3_ADIRI|nr:unnamed protein product [Adineta ricciae]CAF1248097.1 unnamed protein product [Adineta ricciae]